jgi:hypothetical protein
MKRWQTFWFVIGIAMMLMSVGGLMVTQAFAYDTKATVVFGGNANSSESNDPNPEPPSTSSSSVASSANSANNGSDKKSKPGEESSQRVAPETPSKPDVNEPAKLPQGGFGYRLENYILLILGTIGLMISLIVGVQRFKTQENS